MGERGVIVTKQLKVIHFLTNFGLHLPVRGDVNLPPPPALPPRPFTVTQLKTAFTEPYTDCHDKPFLSSSVVWLAFSMEAVVFSIKEHLSFSVNRYIS